MEVQGLEHCFQREAADAAVCAAIHTEGSQKLAEDNV